MLNDDFHGKLHLPDNPARIIDSSKSLGPSFKPSLAVDISGVIVIVLANSKYMLLSVDLTRHFQVKMNINRGKQLLETGRHTNAEIT